MLYVLLLAFGAVALTLVWTRQADSSSADEGPLAQPTKPATPPDKAPTAPTSAPTGQMPQDLKLLRDHSARLREWTGYQADLSPDQAPWADFGYLTTQDLAKPEIASNVAAMREVMSLITFVAVHEDGRYLGYWHGPTNRRLEDSPIVQLDSEGQFTLVGRTLAGALLNEFYDDEERFDELQTWFSELEHTPGMEPPKDDHPPGKMHHALAAKHAADTQSPSPVVITKTRGSTGDPKPPRLSADLTHFEALGTFQVMRMLGVGEHALDLAFAAESGRWHAYALLDHALDDLVEQGLVSDTAEAQLMLIHESHPMPTPADVPWPQGPSKCRLDHARFTVGDKPMWDALAEEQGFYDLLDGKRGILERGDGLTLGLFGDGIAKIWTNRDDVISIMLVELT